MARAPRRQTPRRQPPQRRAGVVRGVRRMWPVVLEAWRRWDNLPPHQKERYRRMAADYSQRGRDALASRRRRK